jgi:rhodanese-related sulfurtransferase
MQKRHFVQWVAVSALSALSLSVAVAAETPASIAGVKTVSAEEVKKLLDSGTPVVDTRVAAEYAEKTIKGAVSIPYKEKSAKAPDFDAAADQFDLKKLPSNKAAPVVFFCNSGECWKSYKASVVAQRDGYSKVYWFRGGVPEWTSKGLPTQ